MTRIKVLLLLPPLLLLLLLLPPPRCSKVRKRTGGWVSAPVCKCKRLTVGCAGVEVRTRELRSC